MQLFFFFYLSRVPCWLNGKLNSYVCAVQTIIKKNIICPIQAVIYLEVSNKPKKKRSILFRVLKTKIIVSSFEYGLPCKKCILLTQIHTFTQFNILTIIYSPFNINKLSARSSYFLFLFISYIITNTYVNVSLYFSSRTHTTICGFFFIKFL